MPLVVRAGGPIFFTRKEIKDMSRGLMVGHVNRIVLWGLALTLVSLGSCGNGEGHAPRRVDAALEQYLIAQEALAGDRVDEAVAALQHLSGTAPEPVQRLVAEAKGADVDSVRVLFQSISEHPIDGTSLVDGLRVAHCPMAFDYKGARWIQRDGDIANPYFGARMLHCGVFVDVTTDVSTQE